MSDTVFPYRQWYKLPFAGMVTVGSVFLITTTFTQPLGRDTPGFAEYDLTSAKGMAAVVAMSLPLLSAAVFQVSSFFRQAIVVTDTGIIWKDFLGRAKSEIQFAEIVQFKRPRNAEKDPYILEGAEGLITIPSDLPKLAELMYLIRSHVPESIWES